MQPLSTTTLFNFLNHPPTTSASKCNGNSIDHQVQPVLHKLSYKRDQSPRPERKPFAFPTICSNVQFQNNNPRPTSRIPQQPIRRIRVPPPNTQGFQDEPKGQQQNQFPKNGRIECEQGGRKEPIWQVGVKLLNIS